MKSAIDGSLVSGPDKSTGPPEMDTLDVMNGMAKRLGQATKATIRRVYT
jgi:hypothetical protein